MTNTNSPTEQAEGVKLLPCPNPWCDSSKTPAPFRVGASLWRIQCGCGVRTDREEGKAQAIAAWNRRTPAPPSGERVWQPIETAPKDGSQLLLIARYPAGHAWSDIYQGWWDKFLDDCTGAWARWPHDNFGPTHWMPRTTPDTTSAPPRQAQPPHDVERALDALKPFAEKLADIGMDEADEDTFRDVSPAHRHAPRITVGHLRRAAETYAALSVSSSRGK